MRGIEQTVHQRKHRPVGASVIYGTADNQPVCGFKFRSNLVHQIIKHASPQLSAFIAGDTEVLLTDLIENKKIVPDAVIVDPPRRGLDNTTINNILKIQPKRVAYVSCNPATLVRDLSLLEEKYDIKMIQPVDMFPFTSHVECVSVLELKESTEK